MSGVIRNIVSYFWGRRADDGTAARNSTRLPFGVEALVDHDVPGLRENKNATAFPRFQCQRLLHAIVFQGVKTDREQPARKGIKVLLKLQNASVNDVILARDYAQLPVFHLMQDHAGHGVSGRRSFRIFQMPGSGDAGAGIIGPWQPWQPTGTTRRRPGPYFRCGSWARSPCPSGPKRAGPWPRLSAKRLVELVFLSPKRRISKEVASDTLFRDLAPRAATNAMYNALSAAPSGAG